MKKKSILILLLISLSLPSMAVLDEESIDVTLSKLRKELCLEYSKMSNRSSDIESRKTSQHSQMLDIMRKCNELSLILYSQNPEWTFDMTYAFKEVVGQYEDFSSHKMPYETILSYMDTEIERYARLAESLRRLPPQLKDVGDIPDSLVYHNDSIAPLTSRNFSDLFLKGQAKEDRDTCLYYTNIILNLYLANRQEIINDSDAYLETNTRLRESYDYATARFLDMQQSLFIQPTSNYFYFLRHLDRNLQKISQNYSGRFLDEVTNSEWRPSVILSLVLFILEGLVLSMVIGYFITKYLKRRIDSQYLANNSKYVTISVGMLLFVLGSFVPELFTSNSFVALSCRMVSVFSWIVLATIVSTTFLRWKDNPSVVMRFYAPLLILSFSVFLFRMLFVSNTFLQFWFPLLLLSALIWMAVVFFKIRTRINNLASYLCLGTMAVTAAATVLSVMGYNFLSLVVIVWLSLQIATLQTLYIFRVVMLYYGNRRRSHCIEQTSENVLKTTRGDYISRTWFFDFVEMALVPALMITLAVRCIWYALGVFDLTGIYDLIIHTPFISYGSDSEDAISITLYMLIWAVAAFFFFKYASYAFKSFLRVWKIEKFKKANSVKVVQTTDVNLTLGDNIVGIIVWGSYIIMLLIVFKIPTGALAMVSTGLAAGLGMAMKDIVNNFIYGIQLMSGRLRPGDWIECDGIRGKVTEIKYQCTQIETSDGAVMAFLNTDLLSKNFKNLTRNDRYELLTVPVGISYGSDVEKVRRILMQNLQSLQSKDRFGEDVVDRHRGTTIIFDGFADSSINIAVKQYVLVHMKGTYQSELKEFIYKTLNDNGVEMPFPQRDVHIV